MTEKPVRSSGRAPDPRPARTRARILAAIETLGVEGIELNVANIVTQAGLSRSSFYSQFKDIDDVAVHVVEEMISDLIKADAELRTQHERPDSQVTVSTIDRFLSEFHQRRYLFAALFAAGSGSRQRDTYEIMTRTSLPPFLADAPAGVDPEFAARFLAAGTLASVLEWVMNDDPISVEEMKRRLVSMMPGWIAAQP